MFYSSLLLHKEVNFTLNNCFNQLFSRLVTIDQYTVHPPFPYPATLPFMDPDLTVEEVERGIDELKFKGACIGTNIIWYASGQPEPLSLFMTAYPNTKN